MAGLVTAILVSLPFGLSLPGLIAQVFKTAGGYPYLSVNAYNPWALVSQTRPDGGLDGIAVNRQWVCNSTIVPTGPSEFRIGPFVIPELSSPGSTLSCPDGLYIGAVPAVLVGALAFLIVAALVLWLVARRPDRLTILGALAVLALAFFVLPTRVHERYLFPFAAIAAILAAVSLRWRIAYVLSSLATLANMYAVLAYLYPDNPRIDDWLGIGETLTSFWGVAIAALTQAAVLAWAFFQLREDAVEDLADDVALAGRDGEGSRLGRWLGRPEPEPDIDDLEPGAPEPSGGERVRPGPSRQLPGWASAFAGAGAPASRLVPAGAGAAAGGAGAGRAGAGAAAAGGAIGAAVPRDDDGEVDPRVLPSWEQPGGAPMGPVAWFRARMADRPVRADQSRELDRERGGRLDKLDLWFLALLAIGLLTVRMWRLPEPYQMHFDEVYHPRTATEFLQHWEYGISHEIYEWTHPHLAKYAMALGLMAFGEDEVGATSRLGVAVLDATVEPRRDESLDASAVEGDRLWIATGSEVRAYDLGTRRLAATLDLPGAVAVAYDRQEYTLYAGDARGRDPRDRHDGAGPPPSRAAHRGRPGARTWISTPRSRSCSRRATASAWCRPRGGLRP